MLTRGVVGSLLVLLGGLVGSALPASSPPLGVDLLRLLRESESGRMLGLAVVLAGLGLLAGAWLTLCRSVATFADHAAGIDLARVATLAWSLPLLLAPPLFSRDGWSYAAQGVLAGHGLSPYTFGPGLLTGPISEAVDPRWLFTPTPYGPLPLAFGSSFAQLTADPWLLVIGHRLVALLGLVLLAWAVPRLAAWSGTSPALASGLVLASPLMLANGVGGLHNDLLMVGLMAAALVVGVERSWTWGMLLGGAAAAVKVPGGLVCVAVALASLPAAASAVHRVRRLAQAGLLAGAVVVVLGLVTGVGTGWLSALAVPGSLPTVLSLPTMLGGDVGRQIAMVVFVLGAGGLAMTARTGSPLAALRLTAALTGLLLLCSPVVHIWYLLWCLPFVACLRLSRPASLAVVGVSVLVGLVAPLDSSLHGLYLTIVVGCAMVAALVGVLLLTEAARHRLEGILPVRATSLAGSARTPRRG